MTVFGVVWIQLRGDGAAVVATVSATVAATVSATVSATRPRPALGGAILS